MAIAAGRFLMAYPVDVLGPEVEAAAAMLAPNTARTVPVYFLGPTTTTTGEDLVCRFVDYRWVADRSAGARMGGYPIPDCTCGSIPGVLHMHSSNPTAFGGMFRDCVLAYQSTPPEYTGLNLGAQSWLGTPSFTDENGDSFRYVFYCQSDAFYLSRVYIRSIYGAPFRDPIRYTWPLGFAGNSCRPFLLTDGYSYFGTNTGCVVTISE